ncbi:cell division protein FtsQ [Thioclava dalianensis]|uniref:Cell division protein FtsQ n=1 Tax=Thioclava dalianensis TaxID=1185766 RepID=A0A074TCQ4_9RHOB|nr:cell division protein FtsQ/DivIB [Thioclava dalianensis]KEP69566.1 cell division protein FtsQ [Thioclava dalianensis]SFN14601.1 cell division protein FtsQ [Thioclava dalianensis]
MRPVTRDPVRVSADHRGGMPARVYQRSRRNSSRDPAPSRLSFRLQRLWLTPMVRVLTRVGLPVLVVGAALAIWLGDAGRRDAVIAQYNAIKEKIEHRPEFMISLLKIDGAGPEVARAVRAMLPMTLPASSFDINLDAYRDTIRKLDAVADVSLVIRPGGTLEAKITQRVPVVLWRTPRGLEMLDDTGHRVATLITREARPSLPLIVGQGADQAVPQALRLIADAGPLLPRLRGLERVGERRWDLVLDHDQRIMLPDADPLGALDRILALNTAEGLLERDFTVIDFRNKDRPTIRLSADALAAFRQAQSDSLKARASQ